MCKKIRGDTLSALNVPTISFLWAEIWQRDMVHIERLTKIGQRAELVDGVPGIVVSFKCMSGPVQGFRYQTLHLRCSNIAWRALITKSLLSG